MSDGRRLSLKAGLEAKRGATYDLLLRIFPLFLVLYQTLDIDGGRPIGLNRIVEPLSRGGRHGSLRDQAKEEIMIGHALLVLSLSFLMSLPAPSAWAAEPVARQESVAVQDGTVNVNTASKAELMQLNGVGPALADRIIEYRDAHGGFEKPEDIQKVRGIGNVFWQKNQNAITVK